MHAPGLPAGGQCAAADAQSVDAYLLTSLFSRVKPLLIANIGSALFLTLILWDRTNPFWLAVWAVTLTGWTMMRFVLARGYLSRKRTPAEASRWATYFAIGSGVGGALWGLSVVFFAGFDAEAAKLPMALLMAGLSAAALAGYSKCLKAFFAFIVPALLPYGINLIWLEGGFDPWIAGYFALWFALVWIMAHNLHEGFRDFVALDIHNLGLVDQLTVARDRAEAANVAKSRFLANMSHEFRTPLNAIIGYSEMMKTEVMGPIGNEHYEPYVGDIFDSGQHLLKIVDEILDVSRLESGKVALDEVAIDVGDLLRSAISLVEGMAAKDSIDISLKVSPDLPLVMADETKLRQIAINLLSNAVKYTPTGGKVAASARVGAEGIDIEVADTGIGMTADEVETAVIPFAHLENRDHLERVRALKHDAGQTSNGLGLPLVKLLTECHDGALRIASVPGEGTSVTVHLPAERIAGTQTDDGPASVPSVRRRKNIASPALGAPAINTR